MKSSKFIKNELKSVESLNQLISSLEELSAMRYRKTKNTVLNTRSYLDEINYLYKQVKNNYKKIKESSGEKFIETKFREPTKGTVYVLLTANGGLFGDVINRNFLNFKNYISRIPADEIIVVGSVGQKLIEFSDLKGKINYTYFPLSDSSGDRENLDKILRFCLDFKTIVIFYTKFIEILNQKPMADSVTGDILFEEALASFETTKPEFETDFLFEPDIEKVLGLFETQMINTLFEQKVLESGLSKFTSRMVSLDTASQKTNESLKKLKLDYIKLKHIESNKKANVTLSGVVTLT
jgi:F-type H+-transporting ATPase subunit gamma